MTNKEDTYKVQWHYKSDPTKGGSGQGGMTLAKAQSLAAAMNQKYPEIAHYAVKDN
jgi:hypothetical protein